VSIVHRFINWHREFTASLGCEPTHHQAFKAGWDAAVKERSREKPQEPTPPTK
jgi:hypothetical protein